MQPNSHSILCQFMIEMVKIQTKSTNNTLCNYRITFFKKENYTDHYACQLNLLFVCYMVPVKVLCRESLAIVITIKYKRTESNVGQVRNYCDFDQKLTDNLST